MWEALSVFRWTWTRNGQPLQERYRELHGGRYAPVDPAIRAEWEYAEGHGNWTLYDDTAQRLRAFGEDFNAEILGADEVSCSKSMWVTGEHLSGLMRPDQPQLAIRYRNRWRSVLP